MGSRRIGSGLAGEIQKTLQTVHDLLERTAGSVISGIFYRQNNLMALQVKNAGLVVDNDGGRG